MKTLFLILLTLFVTIQINSQSIYSVTIPAGDTTSTSFKIPSGEKPVAVWYDSLGSEDLSIMYLVHVGAEDSSELTDADYEAVMVEGGDSIYTSIVNENKIVPIFCTSNAIFSYPTFNNDGSLSVWFKAWIDPTLSDDLVLHIKCDTK